VAHICGQGEASGARQAAVCLSQQAPLQCDARVPTLSVLTLAGWRGRRRPQPRGRPREPPAVRRRDEHHDWRRQGRGPRAGAQPAAHAGAHRGQHRPRAHSCLPRARPDLHRHEAAGHGEEAGGGVLQAGRTGKWGKQAASRAFLGKACAPRCCTAHVRCLPKPLCPQAYDNAKSIKGKSQAAVLSAIVFLACRHTGNARTFKEIVAVVPQARVKVGRCGGRRHGHTFVPASQVSLNTPPPPPLALRRT
jgi:hypothetical protein